jgi:hypothetical protein
MIYVLDVYYVQAVCNQNTKVHTSAFAIILYVLLSDCNPTEGNYMGKRSITISGRVCQRWYDDWPHYHSNYDSDSEFPDKTVWEAANYCRNPDNSASGPWCYTLDPSMSRETCGIPSCSGDHCLN